LLAALDRGMGERQAGRTGTTVPVMHVIPGGHRPSSIRQIVGVDRKGEK
jgi:hypothetical protein